MNFHKKYFNLFLFEPRFLHSRTWQISDLANKNGQTHHDNEQMSRLTYVSWSNLVRDLLIAVSWIYYGAETNKCLKETLFHKAQGN